MKRQGGLCAIRVILPFALIAALGDVLLMAQDDSGLCSWQRGELHKMHWAQTPDEGFTGADVSVSQTILADDFRCTTTGPLRSIHIWGSFLGDALPAKGPNSLSFELSVRANLLGPEGAWSRPGEVLWSQVFKPGEYMAAKIHDGPQDWYDPVRNQYASASHRDTYQYDFCIKQEPFVADTGNIYWLAVKDLSAGTSYTFGWRTTARQFHWNDDAVYLQPDDQGWFKMAFPEGHRYANETLDLAFVVTGGDESLPQYDLGDAPDGTNNVPGAVMTAYPDGTVATFPTAYYAGSPPFGPVHRFPRDKFYLGRWVSLEREADIGVEEDAVNNLGSQSDTANRDGGDDGLALPAAMPSCQVTTLKYVVTATGAGVQQPYVNVWCDWNRDGDWNDSVECIDGNEVPEWAVQNQQPILPGPGTYTLTTPPLRCWHPVEDVIDPLWLRITISEQPWQPADGNNPGGAGPEGGYTCGETEDYYIQPLSQRTPVQYDWGDAPDEAKTAVYPTLATHDGARHAIGGPWLGDENDRPDAEEDGLAHVRTLGDNNGGANDEKGVSIPPLVQSQLAAATIEIHGGGGIVQAWIDFDGDRAWQEEEKVHDRFLPDGIHAIPFTVPEDAAPGRTFARFRISRSGGLSPRGTAPDGEVEDHQIWIDEMFNAKSWCQWPDTTPEGMSILVDSSDNKRRAIADDFECRTRGQLSHVRLWGSWKDDRQGMLAKIRLRIHPDDPIGSAGPDKTNRFAKPRPEIFWEKEYVTDQFEETLYHAAHIGGLWWRDAVSCESAPSRSSRIWQIDVDVDPNDAFVQEGLPKSPQIYWLVVEVEAVDGQFGWSTRQWPEHFGANAVWGAGPRLPLSWNETFYPHGHTYYDIERNSVDMAFCLLFGGESIEQVTSRPTSVTQCPVIETTCPTLPTRCPPQETLCPMAQTQCPPMATVCPTVSTQCWTMPTQCPAQETLCPSTYTWCPVLETVCPVTETQCPEQHTQCPPWVTNCPLTVTQCESIETVCPLVQTACPRVVTQCQLVATMCPVAQTQCPPSDTTCPIILTECPTVDTNCPDPPGQSQAAAIQYPTVSPDVVCPVIEADCPTIEEYAGVPE